MKLTAGTKVQVELPYDRLTLRSMKATVTSKGQITIPTAIRRKRLKVLKPR
jgi:hypothetical protein